MGGMSTLEWPLCTPKGYVQGIIPIATSTDHSAWGISWAEAQRQCIYADPAFQDGYYLPTPASQPATGLAAARMVAMLTYRSCESFDTRFGRKSATARGKLLLKPLPVAAPSLTTIISPRTTPELPSEDPKLLTKHQSKIQSKSDPLFSAQSYLQYQGQKFISRFDANCYIHLTRKMDGHDVTRGRTKEFTDATSRNSSITAILSKIFSAVPPGALVIGVDSDVLFRPEQQEMLVNTLPGASLAMIASPEGHDGFLLEFEVLGPLIMKNLRTQCPWIYEGKALATEEKAADVKDSVFGELVSGW
jgi:homoserine O-acetyltransferase